MFAETKTLFMKYQTKEGAVRETSPRLWENIHRHVPGNILIEGAELLTPQPEKKSVKNAVKKEADND